jgi:hypothetical protein
MAHILHIDSSPRGDRSFSRKLSMSSSHPGKPLIRVIHSLTAIWVTIPSPM